MVPLERRAEGEGGHRFHPQREMDHSSVTAGLHPFTERDETASTGNDSNRRIDDDLSCFLFLTEMPIVCDGVVSDEIQI